MNYKDLFQKAKEMGFSDVELTIEKSKSMEAEIFNKELSKNQIHDTTIYTVRGIYENKMAAIVFEDENQNIDELLLKLKDNAVVLNSGEEFEIYAGSESYPVLTKRDSDFDKVDTSDKVKLALELEKKIKEFDKRIVLVEVSYEDELESTRIVNSKGLDIEKTANYGVLVAQVVVHEDGDNQSSFEVVVSNKFADFNVDTLAKSVASKAINMLHASPVESKVYPVIFDNKMSATLIGAFASMFSGEMAMRKLSPLSGKEGEKIMDEKITIIDNPCKDDAISRQPFDDEGVACYEKCVVRDGVFQGLLHNLKTAKYFKTKSTGNGFKQGANMGVRGVNLYLNPGETSEQEMIESTKEGLYITSLQGLHAGINPISGDFSAQASGFLIENGKLVRPVTLIVVSGNFLKMMNDIETIGNNLEIRYTGVGAPSIKVRGLPISGK